MKKDSIVRKQMLLYMTTIGVLIMLLCGSLAVIYTNHYMSEKKNELIVQNKIENGQRFPEPLLVFHASIPPFLRRRARPALHRTARPATPR
ncbi:MAG: hypothetical protein II313_07110, partial [Anaerotignum sp.]|nr:hypothetical protein [Anaerotignum sp.]